MFEAVLPLLNPFARIPVCGLISHYNATELPAGPNRVPLLMRNVLIKRLTFRGFIVRDFAAKQDEFLRDVSRLAARRADQIPRGRHRRAGERARSLHRAAQGREFRQEAGARRGAWRLI